MSKVLLTNISTAHWCGAKGEFEEAKVKLPKYKNFSPDKVSWFDRLLEGGIVLPELEEDNHRALTILLTGPPGSGKSTLALELCSRWSDAQIVVSRDKQRKIESIALSSLYLTSESSASWVAQKARSYGWRESAQKTGKMNNVLTPFPITEIWETSQFKTLTEDEDGLTGFIKAVSKMFSPVLDTEHVFKFVEDKWIDAKKENRLLAEKPDVLVIDSLNTIEFEKQIELYKQFSELVRIGPRIIITILESDSQKGQAEFWEYLSDIVIRLDRKYISDYLVRNIEVVKCRYQPHLWGTHQLKIYPYTDTSNMSRREKRRAHPYRKEGGIFVYPSIHSYLSVYKTFKQDSQPKPFKTPLPSLNALLHGGFPQGKCTGLIGIRGGHKSHLGYYCLLSNIFQTSNNEKCLIISLRDDENVAKKTLNNILKQEPMFSGSKNINIEEFIDNDRLEILYYPPGYVSPEEFFHKMYVSIKRLKYSGKDEECGVTVLFNSLDQLSSRFPLCAKEQMFIPGIIEALSAENITSFFIAVEEPGQPPEQYGLLSMADAILHFTRENISSSNYIGHIKAHKKGEAVQKIDEKKIKKQLPKKIQTVTVRVVRYAGGQGTGEGGILELIDDSSPKFELLQKPGLNFVPFSPSFKQTSAKLKVKSLA